MTITNEIRSKIFKTAHSNYANQDWQSVKRFGHKTFAECLKSSWSFYKEQYGKETFKMVAGSIERETEKAVLLDSHIGINGMIWLPKSQITEVSRNNDRITYALPTWLWNQKAA